MKKLANLLAAGAVLVGACAGGAGSATPPEPVVEAAEPESDAVADSMAESMVDPMAESMADPMTDSSMTEEVDDERDVVDLTAAQAPDPEAVARCQALVAELERREELDLLDEDADGDELSEDQVEQYQHQAPEIDGAVMGAERPSFPDMPDDFDPAAIEQGELFHVVDLCHESGILVDDEGDEGDDAEDMAAFCAELAALSVDEVAEWALDEGDEVVDEEFGWCELQRPDRQ